MGMIYRQYLYAAVGIFKRNNTYIHELVFVLQTKCFLCCLVMGTKFFNFYLLVKKINKIKIAKKIFVIKFSSLDLN